MVEQGGGGDERSDKDGGAAAPGGGGGGEGKGVSFGRGKRGRDEKGSSVEVSRKEKEARKKDVAGGAPSDLAREGDALPSKKFKNVPAHRGAFKRHLRKHTLLFQREGGKVAKGFIVTCIQVCSCAPPLRLLPAQSSCEGNICVLEPQM
jgi:hypothetical protein